MKEYRVRYIDKKYKDRARTVFARDKDEAAAKVHRTVGFKNWRDLVSVKRS